MTAPSIPTVDIEGPAGRRVMVAPRSVDDRLTDLAAALGLDPRRQLLLDGRPVATHDTLGAAGVVNGSRLEPAPLPVAGHPLTCPLAAPLPDCDAVVTVVVEAGPGAGTAVHLPAGRHVVGRSPGAAVPVVDDAMEPHHGLFDVGADGVVRFVQLTGRVTGRLGIEPIGEPVTIPDDSVLVLGASRLRVGRALGAPAGGAVLTATPGDPWRRTLRRTPRPRPRWDPPPIPLPVPVAASLRPGAIGLVATGMTMLGSIGIAVVMGSPTFLVFGAVGVLASVGLWAAGRVGAARDGRRAGACRARELAAFAAAVREQRAARWQHHVATVPSVSEAIAAATTRRADLWARRADHDDAFRLTLGWGVVEWEVVVDGPGTSAGTVPAELAGVVASAERFADAPVPVDLGPGAALALGGAGAPAVTRSLVIQLATWMGPADWRLVVVVDDPVAWDWCRWLPHADWGGRPRVAAADDGEQVAATLGRLQDGDPRHVVVVTDRPDLLARRTGPLRRFVGAAPSVAVVVVVAPGDAAPAMCRSRLEIGSVGLARWWPDTSVTHRPDPVHAAGVPPATAAAVARVLAGLHDPEDPASSTNALPPSVGLGALSVEHGVGPIDDAIAIAAAWRSGGDDPPPVAVLGATADGVVEVDLARDGPHALVAGTTGSGKSELLRTMVASLATRSSPDHLTFVLVDYKGGSTFDACAELPHTVGVVTDLDDRLAERALISLDAEIRRRERFLRAAGAADLTEYRADPGRRPLPRLVVVIDEFAALAAELPSFLSALVGIAQRGRSLGIHLVLATQRPAGVVSDDIRSNTNLRLALRLQDTADARDVVGDDDPATFPRGTPGRTMLRLGPGETVVFQSAHSSGPVTVSAADGLRVVDDGTDGPASGGAVATELAVLVGSIRHAAVLSDVEPPHRPWLPPLPTDLDVALVDRVAPGQGAVGLVDVPAEQRRRPLRWRPVDGSLALLGGRGAGTTSALVSLVVAACADGDAARTHVYVIDGRGDDRLDALDALASCGGVVRQHERERLERLLRRLVGEIDCRRSTGSRSGAPAVIVAVDGMPELRAALDAPTDAGSYELLRRVVTEGATVGVVCIMTGDRPGAIQPALLAACAERWIFHLEDPSEGAVGGVPAVLVPAAIPGRAVVASTRQEVQLAVLDVPPRTTTAVGPPPIGVLPTDVAAATLPPGVRRADGEVELLVGVDFESLGPAPLAVPDGEHVLVAGPARSGRSSVLVRLATSWRDANPGAPVHVVCPVRRSPLSSWAEVGSLDDALEAVRGVAAGQPCLLVVDDAERVADPSGALAALVAERRPGTLVVAAARPDALRGLYGHWTGVVRASRTGVLMAACSEVDGDLLGQLLPRHPPLAARPGLGWLVTGGRRALVQVGRDEGAGVDDERRAGGRVAGRVAGLSRR